VSTRGERQAFMAGLPWATKLAKPKEHCEGIKWNTVAMKDICASGSRDRQLPPRGLQDRSRCKNKGWWRFRALRLRGAWAHSAKSGTYCWAHLVQQTCGTPEEEARFIKAWKER
jgi:hypothetical protein